MILSVFGVHGTVSVVAVICDNYAIHWLRIYNVLTAALASLPRGPNEEEEEEEWYITVESRVLPGSLFLCYVKQAPLYKVI